METFTEKELHKLYYKHVKKSADYFNKHYYLPMCPVKSWNYNWQNFDFPRTWCVLDFKEWVEFLEIGANHPINISNTYLLETKYNWRGIMVEYDGKWLDQYRQHRPNLLM